MFLWVQGRSREGAWIEMSLMPRCLARLRSRSREGAWIEMVGTTGTSPGSGVAPARERGLKYVDFFLLLVYDRSLPRGSVD